MDVAKNVVNALKFGRLEKTVKVHLQNVYVSMGLALLACAAGSYVHMYTKIITAGILPTIGTFVAMITMLMMAPTAENQPKRFALLLTTAFLCGISQGPLLELVVEVDESIVMTAFLATSLIFLCFSVSALLSEDRKWIAMGGILLSSLSWLVLFGFLNIFFQSQLIYQVSVYFGLFIFCGFVLYDTQLIVEKARRGDNDYIAHCLDLFLDFLNIFRYLLIILTDKEVKRDNRRKKD
jgi:FtsH-binding integral membrane protein